MVLEARLLTTHDIKAVDTDDGFDFGVADVFDDDGIAAVFLT